MSWTTGLLGGIPLAILTLVAIAYLGLPLLIWNMFRFDLGEIDEIPPDAIENPGDPDDPTSLAGMITALDRIGFVEIARCNASFLPNVDSMFALFALENGSHLAMVAEMTPHANETMPAPETKRYVEFSTEYTDDREVNTNNSPDLPSADSLKSKTTYGLPDVADPEELWRLHQTAVDLHRQRASIRPAPMDRDPVDFLIDQMRGEFQKKVDKGLYVTRETDVYTPTLRCAYLMTLGELPPFKQLRRSAANRRARNLKAEAERRGG
ncbi:MAG: hypothetical protein AAF823_09365 [Planctomycetota bacterium]